MNVNEMSLEDIKYAKTLVVNKMTAFVNKNKKSNIKVKNSEALHKKSVKLKTNYLQQKTIGY